VLPQSFLLCEVAQNLLAIVGERELLADVTLFVVA